MVQKDSHIHTWKLFREGQKEALLSLYNEHYIGLMNYGLKVTNNREMTKDVIAQVILRLWDQRSALPEVKNVRAYLLTTLHREILTEIKQHNKRLSKYTEAGQLLPIEEKSYEEHIIQLQQNHALKQHILAAFNHLTPREKELLQLKFFEDLDYEDIAERCVISKRTAYNIIHQALKTLRVIFTSAPAGRNTSEKIILS